MVDLRLSDAQVAGAGPGANVLFRFGKSPNQPVVMIHNHVHCQRVRFLRKGSPMRALYFFISITTVLSACVSPAVVTGRSAAAISGSHQLCYGVQLPDAAGREYAAEKEWYRRSESLRLFDDVYVKFGLPREAETIVLDNKWPDELVFVGTYDGVPMYASRVATPRPQFLYLPLNERCDFQKYAQGALVR